MARKDGFKGGHGASTFVCVVCKHNTRRTNETAGLDTPLCPACYEYAGEENAHSDHCHDESPEAACPVCAGIGDVEYAELARSGKLAERMEAYAKKLTNKSFSEPPAIGAPGSAFDQGGEPILTTNPGRKVRNSKKKSNPNQTNKEAFVSNIDLVKSMLKGKKSEKAIHAALQARYAAKGKKSAAFVARRVEIYTKIAKRALKKGGK